MDPLEILPGGFGIIFMMDKAVILFQQPLSPTMPRVCPRLIEKLTSSTARITPSSVLKTVLNPVMSSSG